MRRCVYCGHRCHGRTCRWHVDLARLERRQYDLNDARRAARGGEAVMETPRFKVTSLTGYSGDTAYCYDLCFETFSRGTAEAVAAEFNAGDMKAAARRYRERELGVIRRARYRAAARERRA